MKTAEQLDRKNPRARIPTLGLSIIAVILFAGCSASGEGSSSSSPQPPAGGATVGAGGNAPSNGLFGTLAALGVAAALVGLVGASGRKEP